MIQYFRNLLAALQSLSHAIRTLVDIYGADVETRALEGNSEARLASLELSRLKWQGEMEALVVDAKGKFRSANNAEARARTHAKAAEVFDGDDEEGEDDVFSRYLDELSGGDAEPGTYEEVPHVPHLLGHVSQTPREVRASKKAEARERRA